MKNEINFVISIAHNDVNIISSNWILPKDQSFVTLTTKITKTLLTELRADVFKQPMSNEKRKQLFEKVINMDIIQVKSQVALTEHEITQQIQNADQHMTIHSLKHKESEKK